MLTDKELKARYGNPVRPAVNPHTKSKIPIPGVKSGGIAPWFGQPGGGTQHLMPMSIEDLLKGGFIEPIG